MGYTTPSGEKISWKEFMLRWKKGMKGVTALQQTKSQMWGMYIMLVGIVGGIVVTFIDIKTLWWVTIILIGALFNTCIQWLGMWQKKILLESFSIQSEGGAS